MKLSVDPQALALFRAVCQKNNASRAGSVEESRTPKTRSFIVNFLKGGALENFNFFIRDIIHAFYKNCFTGKTLNRNVLFAYLGQSAKTGQLL